jgi:hypothetical protein
MPNTIPDELNWLLPIFLSFQIKGNDRQQWRAVSRISYEFQDR